LEKEPKMPPDNDASRMKLLVIRMTIAVTALAVCACLSACDPPAEKPAGPPEKVTFAVSATTDSVLAQVAQAKGFLRREGLEVTVRPHPYGKPALEDLLAGKADFATVAETPVMFAIMKGAKISVVATIETSSKGNAIIARKDRGILSLADLKGRKVAVTRGTTSDYFLDAVLAVNGIARHEVTVVDLNAEQLPEALAKGEIDAVSAFSPYTILAQEQLGKSGIAFHDKEIYTWTFNVVATRDFIRKHPDRVAKMLRALVRAEAFARDNAAEAQKIVIGFSGIDPAIVRDVWADTRFVVSLDQTLVIALEDESRGAMKHGLTEAKTVPNYLDYIYFDGLKAVRPEAVRILR